MLLARVPEVAFVMLVLGQNCPAYYHPVVVGIGTFDCLGEYGLEAIARPWAWGRAPIDRRCLHLLGRGAVLACTWCRSPCSCLMARLQDIVCADAQCLLVLHLQLSQNGQLSWGERGKIGLGVLRRVSW